jgi:spermidine synthase
LSSTQAEVGALPPPGFLMLTSGLCGGLVMVIEVLGSRVIGPFFGVSLFVWTALITVALLALACGYACGGWMADRQPAPARLYALIIGAGVLCALVPLAKSAVLQAALPLGLRGGAFVAATVLFGPSLFLLGCVSPYVLRIAIRELGRVGRTAGAFSAISTAGSCIGTLLTGFYLIAVLGVAEALYAAGLLLVLLGSAYFVFYGRRRVVALAPLLMLALLPRHELARATLADGTRAEVVYNRDTYYGNLKVVDYRFGERHVREMLIDGLVQGGLDMVDGRSVYEYNYVIEALALAHRPQARSALVIGLGPGVLPARFAARGMDVTVVDINHEVERAARAYFGYRPDKPMVVEDARYFLAGTPSRYEIAVVDVFSGDTTPGHLLSREALAQLKSAMTPDGVALFNLIGDLGAEAQMTAAIVRTLGTLFRHVSVRPVFDLAQGSSGNLTIAASDAPPAAAAGVGGLSVHPAALSLVEYALARTVEVPGVAAAPLLSDNHNPLDVKDLRVKEGVRRLILANTPAAILLSD